jgi:hypothetical protein
MPITDEMLMAYADGELSPADMALVDEAMASDESLAERVAIFADTRRTVKQVLTAAPAPVSDDLVARVRQIAAAAAAPAPAESAKVIDLASRRRPAALWQMGIAASVALAVGLTGGWFAAGTGSAPSGAELASLGDPAVLAAVAQLPSGSTTSLANGGELEAIASFRAADGALCREYAFEPTSGTGYVAIACHAADTWDLRFAVAHGTTAEGYTPASSLETLDAFLMATEAGQPLSLQDEAAALSELSGN